MGAYEENSGNHARIGGSGREHVPFVGKAPDYHSSPTHNGADVVLTDGTLSKMIAAARMSYDIENAPNVTVTTDVFAKMLDAFGPPGLASWFSGLTSARQELYRDCTAAQPDPLKDPVG